MSESTQPVSDESGSTATVPAQAEAGQTDAAAAGGQQTGKQPDVNPAQDYKELEKKLGEQGQELGQFRDFFNNVSPLLTKLDSQPELIQAILDDKIDTKLVSAILGGKVKIEEAQQVADAHQQVKQEMGAKEYQNTDPAEIERRVIDKVVSDLEGKIEQKFKAADEVKAFEDRVKSFIDNTSDFEEYADKINIWLNEHPDQDDIEVAYAAVKGVELSKQSSQKTADQIAEEAKQAALNASGNATPASGKIIPQKSAVDELIGNVSNPNSFRF